jgi:hypothetical protein
MSLPEHSKPSWHEFYANPEVVPPAVRSANLEKLYFEAYEESVGIAANQVATAYLALDRLIGTDRALALAPLVLKEIIADAERYATEAVELEWQKFNEQGIEQ